MSKPKQWKAGRDVKRAEAWEQLYDKPRSPLERQMIDLGCYPPHETADTYEEIVRKIREEIEEHSALKTQGDAQ